MNARRLIVVQVIIGVISMLIILVAMIEIVPLLKMRDELKADVQQLQTNQERLKSEVNSLEAKRTELVRANDACVATAKPVAATQVDKEGWLYVGRVNDTGHWAPPSEGVMPDGQPNVTHDFKVINVQKNSAIYDNVIDSSLDDSLQKRRDEPLLMVKAGTKLDVLDVQTQDSLAKGKYIWVKVRVPTAAILQISG